MLTLATVIWCAMLLVAIIPDLGIAVYVLILPIIDKFEDLTQYNPFN